MLRICLRTLRHDHDAVIAVRITNDVQLDLGASSQTDGKMPSVLLRLCGFPLFSAEEIVELEVMLAELAAVVAR